MTGALLYGYFGGWVLTSVVVALAAWRLQDKFAPAAHPRLLSIVAGAAWPVLIVALAQAGAVALTTEVMREDQPLLSAAA